MDLENEGNYHVGQHVEGFIECEWKRCLITSIKASIPIEYGVTTLKKGRSFYLYSESLRVHQEKLVMVDDSLDKAGMVLDKEINFSLVSSDDETLFITQSNPMNNSLNVSGQEDDVNPMEDSLLDFAMEADALTLDSPGETAGSEVNRLSMGDSPPQRNSPNTSVIDPNAINTEDEPAIQEYHVDIVEDNLPEISDKVNPGPDAASGQVVTEPCDRFPDVSESDMEMLQRASKSERTHKQTLWGVKVLTGTIIFSKKCHISLFSVINSW